MLYASVSLVGDFGAPFLFALRDQWSAKNHVEKSKVLATCVEAIDTLGNVMERSPKLTKLHSNSTSVAVRLSSECCLPPGGNLTHVM